MADVIGPVELSAALQLAVYVVVVHGVRHDVQLLDAFKYGVPPHAGLAYGLDRLVMLLTGADSIREVIAFPKVKDASCLMTDAPNVVDLKQLDELGISINPTEEKE